MTDPFSLAAGVAGIVSLSGHVFHGINNFRKQAAGAHPAVAELSKQTRNLSGILQNLSLLAASLEDESGPGKATVSLKAQHLNSCRQTLHQIDKRLKKSQDDFASGSKLRAVSRSLKWPFSVEETKELLDEIASHQRTLELALAADTMVTLLQCLAKQEAVEESVDKLRNAIERRFSIDARVKLNAERTKVADFFLRINPQPSFQACLNLRQPMTGLWLTESNTVFSQWKDGHNSRIWLNGIPGAGKTVLCGSVIEEVLQDSSTHVAVAFFFCDYKNEKSQETINILSVLAAQLAQQSGDAFELLETYYADLHPEKRLRKEPSTNDLLDVIQQMANIYDKVFLVIDGLDECGENVRHVLQSLKLLVSASPAVSMALFSRDEPEVRDELADEFDDIEISAHTEDLELYVRAEMAKRSQLSGLAVKNPTLDEEIRQSLINGAKGMFRWVACQIDHLCELPTNRARRKALEELPPTLFETYDRILERLLPLPIEVRNIAQKTLYWIGLGQNLSMDELCEAVSVPDDVDEMDADDVVSETEIFRRCSSLVRRSFGHRRLEFAHFTVLEYLQRIDASSPLAFFRFSRKRATSSCFSTSFRFLTFADFERRPMAVPSEMGVIAERNEKHPFHRRAAAIFLAGNMDKIVRDVFSKLLQDASFFRYAEKLFDPKKPGIFLSWVLGGLHHWLGTEERVVELATCVLRPGFTPLHVAAGLSQPAICRFLLDKGIDANSSSDLGTPLHSALVGTGILQLFSTPRHGGIPFHGQFHNPWSKDTETTISLLLDHGADPSQTWRSTSALATAVVLSLKRWDPRGLLPLLRPTTAIPDDAVQEFERIGKYASGGYCKQYCKELLDGLLSKVSKSGSSSNLARLLPSLRRIMRQVDVDLSPLPQAMQYVADMSDKDILEAMKVAARFDIGEDIKTLMAYAVSARRDWALRAGKTPMLHIAAKNDSKEAVAALLDFGFDVDTTDDKGRTALYICCEHGHPETARALLERGARIEGGPATEGQSAWHIAAHHEATGVLSLLFEFDKESAQNIAVVSDEGQTPLACSVLSGAAKASRLILDRCQKPYHQDLFRSNLPLLHAAAEFGNKGLFCRLIDSGVVLPETSDDGSTPLHHLRPFCSVRFVKHLLSRYDPFQPRDDGKIPLELILLRLDDREGERRGAVDAEVVRSLLPPDHVLPRAGAAGLHLWEFFCAEVISRFNSPCASSIIGPHSSVTGSSVSVSSRSNVSVSSRSSVLVSSRSSDEDDADGDQQNSERSRTPTRNKGVLGAFANALGHKTCKKGIICSVTDALIGCGVLASFERTDESPAFEPLFSALLARAPDPDKIYDTLFCNWIVPIVNAVLESTTFPKKESRSDAHGNLLMRAIWVRMHPLVAALLKYDSDVHSAVGADSPIELVCGAGSLETLQVVLKHVDKDRINEIRPHNAPHLFKVIVGSGPDKFQKIKALLRHGADRELTAVTSFEQPASLISVAAEQGQFDTVELLREMGADLYGEHSGFTVATAAVSRGNFTLLKILQQGDVPQGYWDKTFPMRFLDMKQNPWVLGKACTLLHAVASSRNEYMVQYLLDQDLGLNINAASEQLSTPLHVAAVCGDVGVVRALIERGANVNLKDGAGMIPLERALDIRALDVASVLAEAGSVQTSIPRLMGLQAVVSKDLNEPVGRRRSAFQAAFDLEYAITTGDLKECKAIIDEGFSVDMALPSCRGCPPLFAAVRANRPDIISWLVSRGANPDNVSCEELYQHFWSLASLATLCLESMECLEELLTYVLDCGIDAFGWPYNPLHVAVLERNMPALRTVIGHIRSHEKAYRRTTGFQPPGCCAAMPEPLLAHLVNKRRGALYYTQPNSQPWSQQLNQPRGTPLHIASFNGDTEAARILIAAGADVNAANKSGESPLIITAVHNFIDTAELLIDAGAHLNHRDDNNFTPAMRAAEEGILPTVELLGRRGADLCAADEEAMTALDLAMYEPVSPGVFGYLLSQGVPLGKSTYGVTTAERALRAPETRSFVFHSGMMWDNPDALEQLLSKVISYNDFSFVKKFYRALPGPVARRLTNMKPRLWFSPLCQAAIGGDVACARILLDHGAEIDMEGSPEGSPLMAACSYGRLGTVRLLVRRGARLEYMTEGGEYRNAFVSMRSHPHVIKWFLLDRFQEQKRLDFCPAAGAGEVKPWAGVRPFRLKLPRDLWQRRDESMMDVLRRRQAFRERIRGKVVG